MRYFEMMMSRRHHQRFIKDMPKMLFVPLK